MGKSRFLFHAFAAGLSGRIHRPFEEVLEVQAASALPPSGGASSGMSKGVKIRDFFSCDSVMSRATGSYEPATGTHETRVSASAEKFDLAGVVTADLIRAEVHSSHKAGNSQPSIIMEGSKIINLKVNGTAIELQNFSEWFTELNTLDKLRERHRSDAQFRADIHEYTMAGKVAELEDKRLHRYFPFCHRRPGEELLETRHAAILPLFRVVTPSGPGFKVFQNVIHIENFGRLHLGELVISASERRVTALHIDLGSPTEGEVTGCSVGANGSELEPPIG